MNCEEIKVGDLLYVTDNPFDLANYNAEKFDLDSVIMVIGITKKETTLFEYIWIEDEPNFTIHSHRFSSNHMLPTKLFSRTCDFS